ncbi:MAG TPA: glycosyltransferase family 2 protein [Gammaproteobacteria bacterium]|nr:glycosyltransferase family 2 protein [Gammaproteobacteria bacterium]
MDPKYTVAICTHNRAARLGRTLQDLSKLHTPRQPWELLLVDNASRDATPEVLAAFTWPAGWHVRVVREEKLGLSNARNRAIAEARGEYIIFIDDDETVEPGWLIAFESLITSTTPDAFGGRIAVMFEDLRPRWLTDELLGFLGELARFPDVHPLDEPSTSFYGGNFGFRRSIIEKIGNFSPDLGRKGGDNTGGEEVEFYRRALKAGLSIWWTPYAVIHHRIQAAKLKPAYFRDLHFKQGRMEASRELDNRRRIPPLYLFGQLARSVLTLLRMTLEKGASSTVRQQMNVWYFAGRIIAHLSGPRA